MTQTPERTAEALAAEALAAEIAATPDRCAALGRLLETSVLDDFDRENPVDLLRVLSCSEWEQLSSGEQVIVRLIQVVWNGQGGLTVSALLTVLDSATLGTVLTILAPGQTPDLRPSALCA